MLIQLTAAIPGAPLSAGELPEARVGTEWRLEENATTFMARELLIADDRVAVWYCRVCDFDAGVLALPETLGLMSNAELVRYRQFHFEYDRQLFVATRVLLRCVLSRFGTAAPREWRFARNAYGRSAIASPSAVQGLHFNLSHTRDLVVCAVSACKTIGVDAEWVAPVRPTAVIVPWALSSQEALFMATLPPAAQRIAFYRFWTLKEAYVKARGMGLSLPLSDVMFDIRDKHRIDVAFKGKITDCAMHWRFRQFSVFGRYIVAIAGRSPPL